MPSNAWAPSCAARQNRNFWTFGFSCYGMRLTWGGARFALPCLGHGGDGRCRVDQPSGLESIAQK